MYWSLARVLVCHAHSVKIVSAERDQRMGIHLEPSATSAVFEPPLESGGAKLSDQVGGVLPKLFDATGNLERIVVTKGEATTPGGTPEPRYAPHTRLIRASTSWRLRSRRSRLAALEGALASSSSLPPASSLPLAAPPFARCRIRRPQPG